MKRAARKAEALGLHLAGISYRAIGEQLGISAATACRWVRECLALERADRGEPPAAPTPAEAKRDIIAAVRDHRAETHRWIDAVRDAAADHLGDPAAANVVIRTCELVARIEGLTTSPAPPVLSISGAPVFVEDVETGELRDISGAIFIPSNTVAPPTSRPLDQP